MLNYCKQLTLIGDEISRYIQTSVSLRERHKLLNLYWRQRWNVLNLLGLCNARLVLSLNITAIIATIPDGFWRTALESTIHSNCYGIINQMFHRKPTEDILYLNSIPVAGRVWISFLPYESRIKILFLENPTGSRRTKPHTEL